MGLLRSSMCKQAQLESSTFKDWALRMHEDPHHLHRKIWEYEFVAQALFERDMLRSGRRGLGFAVGRESLPALFASLGCDVLATDLDYEKAARGKWVETAQYAGSLEALNAKGVCDDKEFRDRVAFRFVDMRALPDDLGVFDFLWSSCSLEHLGTLALGEKFIQESLKYLRPGGIAVHTTEYNLSSNFFTLSRGQTVLYRRKDIERIATDLRQRGCSIDLDFTQGDGPHDRFVDRPPYKNPVHLRLKIWGHVVTSFGLIIQKA